METSIKVALVGATGKAGKYILKQLLADGYQVKALIRKAVAYQHSHPSLQIIEGDIKDYQTAVELIHGCDVVISAIGQVKGETLISSLATANIIRVMDHLKLKRYILLTGSNLDVAGDHKSVQNREGAVWMRKTFPVEVADKQLVYELLCHSDLDWTLVRLPWIEQTDETRGFAVNLYDCAGERVCTTDLATFVIAQLSNEEYYQRTPFVWSLDEK